MVGPLISAAAKSRVEGLIQIGVKEGARLVLDGRGVCIAGGENGHFVGPTVLGRCQAGNGRSSRRRSSGQS